MGAIGWREVIPMISDHVLQTPVEPRFDLNRYDFLKLLTGTSPMGTTGEHEDESNLQNSYRLKILIIHPH